MPTRPVHVAPLRVAHVLASPYPQLLGGAERWFAGVTDALRMRDDVRVSAHYLIDRDAPPAPVDAHGHRCWCPPGRHGFRFAVAPGCLEAIRGADALHVSHYGTVTAQALAIAARFARVPAFVTDHGAGGVELGRRTGLARLFRQGLDVSPYAAGRSIRGRSAVVWGGVDTDRFAPRSDVDDGSVLYVGRVLPHKGIDVLLDAVPADQPVVIAGRAPHATDPYLEVLRGKAAGRPVRFALDVSDDELLALYDRARVAVLPSVHVDCFGRHHTTPELFGLTAAEALSCATPVIASDVGPLRDVVRDGQTGAVVPAGDARALGRALERYLEDPELARVHGAAGRRDVLDRFTWEQVAQRCVQRYRAAR